MMERYIKTRIEQLVDDMNRASNEHDKQWYNRLIQELDWVLMMDGKKTKRNCSIDDATPAEWDEASKSVRDAHASPNATMSWTQDMSGTGQYIYGENNPPVFEKGYPSYEAVNIKE